MMPNNKYAQLFTHLGATMYVIMFIAGEGPYTSTFLNRQEVINESVVLLASYPLFVFTPWVYDDQRRSEVGWFLVACLLLNIVFNIACLLYQLCKMIKRKCRLYNLKQKNKAEFEIRRMEYARNLRDA